MDDIVGLGGESVEELVQQLLIYRGCYDPVQFLVYAQRVSDDDLALWRQGDIPYLEDVFIGRKEIVFDLVNAANAYASKIGLRPERIFYRSIRDPSLKSGGKELVRPIRVSKLDALDALFVENFCPEKRQDGQLDLFYDNQADVIAQRVLNAFGLRDCRQIEMSLKELYKVDPNYPDLGGFESLLKYLIHVNRSVLSNESFRKEVTYLDQKIAPLVSRLFMDSSTELLAFFWQRLACFRADNGLMSASLPSASELFSRAGNWEQVIHCGELEMNEALTVSLLIRLVEAADSIGDVGRVHTYLSLFCWCFKDAFIKWMNMSNVSSVEPLWVNWNDLEIELEVSQFPAFCLILLSTDKIRKIMALMFQFDKFLSESLKNNEYWQNGLGLCELIGKLVEAEELLSHSHETFGKTSIEIRKKLQETAPGLFEVYKRNLLTC